MSRIARDVLDKPVKGRKLAPGPFGAQIAEEGTLVVFVRHFG